MNFKVTPQITAAVLVAITTAPVFAADTAVSAKGPVPFESIDTDTNGYVSQDEFNTMRSERIRTRTEEQSQLRNMGKAPAFSDIDADADGRLNREEAQVHHRKRHEFRNRTRQENREHNRMDRPMGGGPGIGGGHAGMSPGGGKGGRK